MQHMLRWFVLGVPYDIDMRDERNKIVLDI